MAVKLVVLLCLVLKANSASELDTTTAQERALATTDGGSAIVPMKVDVQGQSGKFTVYPKDEGPSAGIQVIMDALREVDSSGELVGTQGSQKHSIQTFASQSFEIDPMETVELEGGVSAVKVSFESPVSSVGNIGVDTYIVTQDGEVGPPGEKWAVRVGDLKWNIRLSEWTFCDGSGSGACRANDIGEFIELDISVKSRADADDDPSIQDNKTVSLGGGSTLELSSQVYKDDADWVDMPSSYPRVAVQGKTTTITFRFPKFMKNVVYDPVITSASGDADGSTSTSASGDADGSTSIANSVSAATFSSPVGFVLLVSFALTAMGLAHVAF